MPQISVVIIAYNEEKNIGRCLDSVKDIGPVGIVGFCLGGSVVYGAATKANDLSAAVGFIAGRTGGRLITGGTIAGG